MNSYIVGTIFLQCSEKNLLTLFIKFLCVEVTLDAPWVITNHKSPLFLTNLNKGLDSATYAFFRCPDNMRITVME